MGYTKQQPKDGEIILHCGHLETNPHHFFGIPETEFTRPDTTKGKSSWIVLCQSCFNIHAEDPTVCIRADASWIGDEPAIKENFN